MMKREISSPVKAAAVLSVTWTLAAAPLPAQAPAFGTFEIGAFGQYTDFQRNAGCVCNWPEDDLGLGGRVGVFYNSVFSFELDAGHTVADRVLVGGTLRYLTVAGRAMVNHYFDDLAGPSVFVGAGPMLGKYENVSSRYGASGVAGFRYGLSEQLALRVDGIADYMPSEQNLNLAARVGGSLMLGYPSRPVVPLPPPSPPPPAAPELAPAATRDSSAGPPTTTNLSAITAPVYFDFDRWDLRPDGRSALEIKLPWLRVNPQLRLRLEGNADDRGTTAYNIPLGMQRAIEVRDYLISSGIAPERLEIISFGDTRPRCSSEPTSDDCHQVNRRVDFEVIGGTDGGVRIPD